METFIVTIHTENAAFEGGDKYDEVARILRVIANSLQTGSANFSYFQALRDSNGNDVGRAAFKQDIKDAAS